MVLETAVIAVRPGQLDAFLAELPKGIELLKQAPGFISIEVLRGEEQPDTVLLQIRWRSLEDHTVGFREGPLFPQWRSTISPFFVEPPTVTHWHPALEI